MADAGIDPTAESVSERTAAAGTALKAEARYPTTVEGWRIDVIR